MMYNCARTSNRKIVCLPQWEENRTARSSASRSGRRKEHCRHEEPDPLRNARARYRSRRLRSHPHHGVRLLDRAGRRRQGRLEHPLPHHDGEGGERDELHRHPARRLRREQPDRRSGPDGGPSLLEPGLPVRTLLARRDRDGHERQDRGFRREAALRLRHLQAVRLLDPAEDQLPLDPPPRQALSWRGFFFQGTLFSIYYFLFSTYYFFEMSGHSKWKQIKHQKEAADQKRGLLFSKLLKAIAIAAKDDSNPQFNLRLRAAIREAKEGNVPFDNIERAVKRASERSEALEELLLEGYGPGGAALLIVATTDNSNP